MKTRNPIARVIRQLRPQVVQDKRRLAKQQEDTAEVQRFSYRSDYLGVGPK